MTSHPASETIIWKQTILMWGLLFGMLAVLTAVYFQNLALMAHRWESSPEYGYGYMIPLITLFLVWQRKDRLERLRFEGSWAGVIIALAGILVFLLGELSTIYTISQYSFVVVLLGIALAIVGVRGIREIWVPLLLLFFMIPLPGFIFNNLSASLQLISSELGVAFVRLFGISVYLEGNVIDLGTYKLQVVEACSGLRYLFPLASLAFIAAYLYKQAFWKKAVVFLSSIPITVGMNSFRIGIIGILVEFWGTSMAEGFLHFFEGWVIFIFCMAILIGEMWLLSRIGSDKRAFADVFNLDMPEASPKDASIRYRPVPVQAWVVLAVLVATLAPVYLIGERDEIVPSRAEFDSFPMNIAGWTGKRDRIESYYLDELKLDDYLLADFHASGSNPINLYVAYYSSQRKGEAIHSPRSCLPGGGWQIKGLTSLALPDVMFRDNRPLTVNRAIIQQGEHRQLVYYWFQQRGRNLTNEYVVKWYLFWDALNRNRSDGALVRLVMPVAPGMDLSEADRQLTAFTREIISSLGAYVPD